MHIDQNTHQRAFLDDYAFLLDAIIMALQIQWSSAYFSLAVKLANILCDSFFDKIRGGFFFTGNTHETLIHRPKSLMDEAIPSGSGLATYNLLRLGHWLNEPKYINAATQSLQQAWPTITNLPMVYHSFLNALRLYLKPPTLIIIRGNSEQLIPWQKLFWQEYHPHTLCFAIKNNGVDLPAFLAQYPQTTTTTAYICQNQQCQPGINNLDEFVAWMKR